MPHNVQSMAYAGDVPWHRLGVAVDHAIRAVDMITAAGLDWTVVKRPARGAKLVRRRRNGHELYSRYEIVRQSANGHANADVVLGLVSERYEPLQNCNAFTFFDPIVDRKTAFFETAGALGDGEQVWVMAKMPELLEVVRGDDCQKYLLLSNSHTGRGSVIVKFTAVRVVCQNTLMLAMEDGQQAFRVRHSKSMSRRLSEIQDLIVAANETYAKAATLFKKMATIRLKPDLLAEYLEAVFPKTKTQESNGHQPPKRDYVRSLLQECPDLQLPGVDGTLWAAYNAVTRFEDYRVMPQESPNGRLKRVWFGAGARLKLKALNAAAAIAQSN